MSKTWMTMEGIVLLLVILQLRIATTRTDISIVEIRVSMLFLIACISTSIWLAFVQQKERKSKEVK